MSWNCIATYDLSRLIFEILVTVKRGEALHKLSFVTMIKRAIKRNRQKVHSTPSFYRIII